MAGCWAVARSRSLNVALVGRRIPLRRFLADIDVEVVVPEVGHDLEQLSLAQDGAQDLGLLQFVVDDVHAVGAAGHQVEYLAVSRREVIEEQAALRIGHELGERDALVQGHFHERLDALVFGKCEHLVGEHRGCGLLMLSVRSLLVVTHLGAHLGRHLGIRLIGALLGCLLRLALLVFGEQDFIRAFEHLIGRLGALTVCNLANDLVGRKRDEQLIGREIERRIIGKTLVENRVRDADGV
jgi:hypothetical protein